MNRDDRFVVCQPDGRIEHLAEEGFFARDTRFVSGYEVFLRQFVVNKPESWRARQFITMPSMPM